MTLCHFVDLICSPNSTNRSAQDLKSGCITHVHLVNKLHALDSGWVVSLFVFCFATAEENVDLFNLCTQTAAGVCYRARQN